MGRPAVYGADHAISCHEHPDIPARFLHVFLEVKEGMEISPERFLVFEHGLGGVPVVHPGQ